jgi:hypothetical protein
MTLNFILLLISAIAWWVVRDGVAVYRVMAAMIALAALALMSAHLVMAIYYAISHHRASPK